jgi:regulator of replication initiation timing
MRFSKRIPKNIAYDKETLYDNTLQLKVTINNLVQENMFLKAKTKKLEEEIARKGKLLDGMATQSGSTTTLKQIGNIKQKVRSVVKIDTVD